jgi:hypothetical protein
MLQRRDSFIVLVCKPGKLNLDEKNIKGPG